MNLKRRLGRLGPPGPSESAPHVKDDRARTLDSLKAKMDDILGREAPAPRAVADPEQTQLPFSRETTPYGPVCRRFEALAPSHHVGRIPVDGAGDASIDTLALLALDPEIGAASARGALFLDTETTGLGGGTGTFAFLVGLAFFDDDALCIEQFLLRSPAEEPPMLRAIAARIESAEMLVTFNGKSFDSPLLESRYVMNRLDVPSRRPHLDLVHLARRLHKSRIGKCTLKAVEANVLGFEREFDVDGSDVPSRYSHFLRTGDEEALRVVVDHNAWDVVSMAALVALYGEPLSALHEEDLVGLARTYQRARALEAAQEAADAAIERQVGAPALEISGRVAKARGDRSRALADFEALAGEVDEPAVRLELAKLYEHHVKAPERALSLVEHGTGETEVAVARRRSRLERKVARRR